MSEKDERIKVMNEVLGGMKVLNSKQCMWKKQVSLEITSTFTCTVQLHVAFRKSFENGFVHGTVRSCTYILYNLDPTVFEKIDMFNLSNRPQVSMVYKLINHVGCW